MTDAEKIRQFDQMQRVLWDIVLGDIEANMLMQTLVAQIVRRLELPGPNGEDPAGA